MVVPILDPVVIDWDADGRMWAIEMPGYMLDIQATRELDPLGRVVVLEDTNADGKLDKRTVFADGLVLARALKVLDRGVLVGEPPNLWLMKDANNDLKMDSKELVTDTYGRRDANVEHNANSLLWALDNGIYTAEVDVFLRLKNGKFEVLKTLARGQWGASQDDAGRVYRNNDSSALHVDLVPAHYFVRNSARRRRAGRAGSGAVRSSRGGSEAVMAAVGAPSRCRSLAARHARTGNAGRTRPRVWRGAGRRSGGCGGARRTGGRSGVPERRPRRGRVAD